MRIQPSHIALVLVGLMLGFGGFLLAFAVSGYESSPGTVTVTKKKKAKTIAVTVTETTTVTETDPVQILQDLLRRGLIGNGD